MRRSALALALLLGGARPAAAQVVSTSPAPDSVEVTVYRDPNRAPADRMELQWLNGYALITERRRVRVPAGEGTIRFEGVASGILPQSAIVTGLPDDLLEKNRDARLLSPAALLDRALGGRVRVRRTDPATGRAREDEAEVLTGPEGAVLLRTAAGVEALRCSGLPEAIVYDSVPPDLSARPTLSIRTRAMREAEAVVTLSYLAAGFDWRANYVAELAPDGRGVDLFAWLTLASNDDTSFREAETQAVAGKPNRRDSGRSKEARGEPIRLQCWPQGTTSDVPTRGSPAPPPPPPPPVVETPLPVSAIAEEITVTGSRIRKATQEELGDLKLYRLPERVTVAANGQKQVAMLHQPRVAAESLHRTKLAEVGEGPHRPKLVLRARNRASDGLGLPLPAGSVALFAAAGGAGGRRVLLGEGSTDDRAVGEEVEVEFDPRGAPVTAELTREAGEGGGFLLTARNATARPIAYEAELPAEAIRPKADAGRVARADGAWTWRATLPANGEATLRYRTAGD